MKRSMATPRERDPFPMTASQEYGWFDRPLAPKDQLPEAGGFYRGLKSGPATEFVGAYTLNWGPLALREGQGRRGRLGIFLRRPQRGVSEEYSSQGSSFSRHVELYSRTIECSSAKEWVGARPTDVGSQAAARRRPISCGP